MPSNPVINKMREDKSDKIKTLTSGVRVLINSISNFEIQEMSMSIADPPPPIIRDPETGRDFENVDDPNYIKAKYATDIKRGLLTLDAVLIGVELVDGLPDDSEWIPVLNFKAKRGIIDISDLDFNNPIEKEFAYKKYVAFVDKADWELLQSKIDAGKEAASKADAMFPSNEEQPADPDASPEA